MSRPALGKVTVGDELLVLRPYSKFRDNEPIPVRAVKVARVWIDLATEGNMSFRMRLDTQNEGSQYGDQTRFVTAAQYEWEQRVGEARDVLRAAKACPDWSSHWWTDGDRTLALADFIRAYDQQHPEEDR